MPQNSKKPECLGSYFLINSAKSSTSEFSTQMLTSGLSVYEVYRLFNGIPLFFHEHIDRLKQSCDHSFSSCKIDENNIVENTKKLVDLNSINNGNVKLLIRNIKNEIHNIMYFDNLKYPSQQNYSQGIKVGLFRAERKAPNIKYVNHELRTKSKEEMFHRGCYEVLLIKDNEWITEGSRSNVFFVSGKNILTPPLQYVLPGITRKKVIEVCKKLNLNLQEESINIADLGKFESAFITGTSPKVLAVRNIQDIGYDVNNTVIHQISETYNVMIEEDLESRSNRW